ncbi:MAG: hypothetical protein KatS3mg113_0164 [Planctomycetaceae bacterium]|nr:MAG: hypothetical protein KatS3mg113_0164 [Planctomycetaceae bacterium]
MGKAPFVLYYPGSSGYYYQVRYRAPERLTQFLADYESLMAAGDVWHVGTHPPGLFVFFYALRAGVQRWPDLARWAEDWQPDSVRESLAILAQHAQQRGQSFTTHDEDVLWVTTLLVMGLSSATVIPLYLLARCTLPRADAWWLAANWAAVPAVPVFIPKSDTVFPLLSTGVGLLTAWGEQAIQRRGWLVRAFCGCGGGMLLWFGMCLSLAFLPILVWWLFFQTWRLLGSWSETQLRWRRMGFILTFIWGFLFPVGWCHLEGVPLLRIWVWNYVNHAGFYRVSPRTWWAWWLVNPLELGYAVGWPLMVISLLVLCAWISRGWKESPWRRSTRLQACVCGVIVGFLLWCSGKNAGEAARLWLLFLPGLVWLAGHDDGSSAADDWWIRLYGERLAPVHRLSLWLAAMLTALCTVHRVSGFPLF